MIEMIAGVFGLKVDGIVKAMDKKSGPFEAGAEQEARLVKLGLAVYVGEPATVAEDEDAPIFDVPPLEMTYSAKELREMGKEYGLTFGVGVSKADMARAIETAKAKAAEVVDAEDTEDEDAPIFDVPPLEMTYSAKELREMGKEYGLTFGVGVSKADMARAIETAKAKAAEVVDAEDTEDEDAPTFDASEAVQ